MLQTNVRLLHLIKTLDIGGIERSTIIYSNKLADNLGFISIFAKKGKYNNTNIVDERVKLFYSSSKISNPLTFPLNLVKIIKIVTVNKINVINYHHRIFLPSIFIIKIFLPKVKILYTHHSIFNDKLTNLIVADKYIAISNSTEKELKKSSKQPIFLVKHGLEINMQLHKTNNEIKNFGYVGRFHKSKGIPILLEAFKKVLKTHKDLKLFLIGEGIEEKNINRYITENHFEKLIFIKKPQVYLTDIYDTIDCLVLPSRTHEGFGLVLAEALSFQIPVISSNLESLKEIAIHEQTGLIFKNGNIEDLQRQMERMIKEEGLRENLAKNGLRFIENNYPLDDCIKSLLEILYKYN